MKKIVTLVLAVALLLTSVVAIAETKATPNINSFAKMTTKFVEGSTTQARHYEIKLSKPVTKLWVFWAEKGAEPEELAVDENLSATALAVEHKYMPGIKQSIGTSKKTVTVQEMKWVKTSEELVKTSEEEYTVAKYSKEDKADPSYPDSPVFFLDEVKKEEEWKLVPDYDEDDNEIDGYWVYYMTEDGWDCDYVESLEEAKFYYEKYFDGYTANVTAPTKVEGKTKVLDKFGNFDHYEVLGFKPGSIQGTKTTTSVNKKLETNKATLADRAFATLEGDTEDFAGWLVYRNRYGNFVAIEAYEGQV